MAHQALVSINSKTVVKINNSIMLTFTDNIKCKKLIQIICLILCHNFFKCFTIYSEKRVQTSAKHILDFKFLSLFFKEGPEVFKSSRAFYCPFNFISIQELTYKTVEDTENNVK